MSWKKLHELYQMPDTDEFEESRRSADGVHAGGDRRTSTWQRAPNWPVRQSEVSIVGGVVARNSRRDKAKMALADLPGVAGARAAWRPAQREQAGVAANRAAGGV